MPATATGSELRPVRGGGPPLLEEVDRAVADRYWAYGYLSYEAAAGLDPALAVSAARQRSPPLVWFGICAAPAEVPPVRPGTGRRARAVRWQSDWTAEAHAGAVHRVREHIKVGDTYKCNLTDRLRAVVGDDLEALHPDLALAQRGAYNAYLDLGRHVVASASPELFFEWSGDRLRTRPMKSTAVRGANNEHDHDQAATSPPARRSGPRT